MLPPPPEGPCTFCTDFCVLDNQKVGPSVPPPPGAATCALLVAHLERVDPAGNKYTCVDVNRTGSGGCVSVCTDADTTIDTTCSAQQEPIPVLVR